MSACEDNEAAKLLNLLRRVDNCDHHQRAIPTVTVPRELILEIKAAIAKAEGRE